MIKQRYISLLQEKEVYDRNVEHFFLGKQAIVVLATEAQLRDHSHHEEGIANFYERKSFIRPCVAWLKGNEVFVQEINTTKKGMQSGPKKISFSKFCKLYEMADDSEVKVIC
jgi:hypothetical protein